MGTPPGLLEPSFVRELEALRRRLEVRARSLGGGDHLAKRRGASAEFSEHRAYTAGDDPRRIDWLAFARTGEPFTKLFRAEEDVILRILIDASLSLDLPGKQVAAKRIAAALAYMALADSERTQVLAANESLGRWTEPVRGRGSLVKVLRELEAIGPRGGTNLASAIAELVRRSRRPGMLVVISDFLDPGPFDTALSRAASQGHDLLLVQVLAEEESRPTLEGDLALEDAETGEIVEVTVDAAAIDAYLGKLEALAAALRAIAKRHGGVFVRTTSTEPTVAAVRRLVARGLD